MRSLSKLLLISALGAGCTSGLWGPFAEDTMTNCNVTPCAAGTCNPTTGYCEGADMGTSPDGGLPAFFYKEETVFKIETNAYYHIAVGDIINDADPEIVLSGDYITKQDAIILSKRSNYGASMPLALPTLTPPQLITSMAPYRYNPSQPGDIVAVTMNANQNNRPDTSGKIFYITKSGTATPNTGVTDTMMPGYKTVAVGYAPDDFLPDIVVTSSLLPLVSQFIYNGNGASGQAKLYNGQMFAMRGTFPASNTLQNFGSGFSLVSLLPLPPLAWANNQSFSMAATRVMPGNTVELYRDANTEGPTFNVQGTADLALLADMDNNGTYDLVLARMLPSLSTLRIYFNTGTNQSPNYGNSQVTISDVGASGDNILQLSSVQALDLDGDGFTDLGVGMYQLNRFILLQNTSDEQGNRIFKKIHTIASTYGARSLAQDDMDGDACKDVVALFGSDATTPPLATEVKLLRGRCK